MSRSLASSPEVEASVAAHDDEYVHRYIESLAMLWARLVGRPHRQIALCGLDVTDDREVSNDVEVTCPICVVLKEGP